MTQSLIQQFADFAATKSGEYQTEDCGNCPMAEFGYHIWPGALSVTAGEQFIQRWDNLRVTDEIELPLRFFSRFVEPFSTWEELAAALRRAAK
jgi:hypothetical protein